jgi:hypothetical protein
MAKPDWQIVHEILERSGGKDTVTTAKVIVETLGKRVRQRHREKDAKREDFSQAAARIVKEATED